MYAGKDATIGTGAELAKMSAENPGERRRDGYPAPFPYRAGFEVPLLAACDVVGPFGARLGRGSAEPQFSPVVGRFFPFASVVIPNERREGDVVLAEIDGLFGPQSGVIDDGEECG